MHTHTKGMMKLVVSSSACFLIIIFCIHTRENTQLMSTHSWYNLTPRPDVSTQPQNHEKRQLMHPGWCAWKNGQLHTTVDLGKRLLPRPPFLQGSLTPGPLYYEERRTEAEERKEDTVSLTCTSIGLLPGGVCHDHGKRENKTTSMMKWTTNSDHMSVGSPPWSLLSAL